MMLRNRFRNPTALLKPSGGWGDLMGHGHHPPDAPVAAGRGPAGAGRRRASLPAYSSARSRHDFTPPQLFAVLTLKQFFETDYRGIVAILADTSDLRAALRPARVPHYSTLAHAAQRLLKKGGSRRPRPSCPPTRLTAG